MLSTALADIFVSFITKLNFEGFIDSKYKMEVPTIKEESFIEEETNKKSVDLDNETRIKINKLLPINKLPAIKKAKLVAKEPPAGTK